MPRHISLVLAISVLSACALNVPTTGTKTNTTAKHSSGSSPHPAASKSPAGTTSQESDSPPPAAVLSGIINIDPVYVLTANAGVISAGGGNVISAGGGNVISAGGGNVISAGGGNVISAGGGNVISAGGGNVISAGGGNFIDLKGGNVITAGGGNIISTGGGSVISAGGGNVISAGGGNVISAGGGNVISAGGGNVISAGGGNYRLLDVAVPSASPQPVIIPRDLMLPVRGMMVVAYSLTKGQLLGKPAFTNEKGEYNLGLSVKPTDNVLIFAAAPGANATDAIVSDARLQYPVVVTPTGNGLIDEDSAQVTRYMATVIQNKLGWLVGNTNTADANLDADPKLALLKPLLQPLVDKLKAAADGLPACKRPLAARQMADALMSLGDLTASIKYDTSVVPPATGFSVHDTTYAGKPVQEALQGIFKTIRKRAAYKLSDPHFADIVNEPFYKAPLVSDIHLDAANPGKYFQKPADFCDFAVQHYLSSDTDHVKAMAPFLQYLDTGEDKADPSAYATYDQLNVAANSLGIALLLKLQSDSRIQQVLVDALGALKDDAGSGTAGCN